jgi:predicted nucleotidyltransferase
MAASKDSFAVISREEAFQIVRDFKKHLEAKAIPVERLYLYGSYCKGKPHYGSDIDVCVISSSFKDRWESNVALRKEAFKVDPRLEAVGYSPEQFQDWIPLVWEIQQTGKLVN